MIDWNEYELVLEEESEKECEVTGREMGDIESFTCPLRDLITPDRSPKWTPEGDYGTYGGYQAYHFIFKKVDDEGVHLEAENGYTTSILLKPSEPENKWSSGWYGFGSWNYCVRLTLRKIKQNESSK